LHVCSYGTLSTPVYLQFLGADPHGDRAY
jgi:hypothetical protein